MEILPLLLVSIFTGRLYHFVLVRENYYQEVAL